MPISYVVSAEDRIVTVTLTGSVRADDYVSTLQHALADPRYEPGFGLLVDARALERLPTVDDIRNLVPMARELSARGMQPFAIVVGNELQFLAGRLFATLANATINLHCRVFRTFDAGRAWLRTTVAARAAVAMERVLSASPPTPLSP